jgi:hypothetical protein
MDESHLNLSRLHVFTKGARLKEGNHVWSVWIVQATARASSHNQHDGVPSAVRDNENVPISVLRLVA